MSARRVSTASTSPADSNSAHDSPEPKSEAHSNADAYKCVSQVWASFASVLFFLQDFESQLLDIFSATMTHAKHVVASRVLDRSGLRFTISARPNVSPSCRDETRAFPASLSCNMVYSLGHGSASCS